MISAPSLHLLEHQVLRNAAEHVFFKYLSQPFTEDDFQQDYVLETDYGRIERPNHGLPHTLRICSLIAIVAHALNHYAKRRYQYDDQTVLELQLCALFRVVGRANEISFSDNKERYQGYKDKSAQAYCEYVKAYRVQHGHNPFHMSDQKVSDYALLLKDNGNPDRIDSLSRVMTFASWLDLIRCYEEQRFAEGCIKRLEFYFKKHNLKGLLNYVTQLMIVMGDRIMASSNDARDYEPRRFYEVNRSVDAAMTAIKRIQCPMLFNVSTNPDVPKIIEAVKKNKKEEFLTLLNIPFKPTVQSLTMIIVEATDAHQGSLIDPSLLNERNNKGRTPLHEACHNGNVDFAMALATLGCDVNLPDPDGEYPLHIAVQKEDMRLLIGLLEYANADPFRVNTEGDTPMMMATQFSLPITKILMESMTPQAHALKNCLGENLSMHLCELGDHELFTRFVDTFTPDLTLKNDNGQSLLVFAAQGGNLKTVQYLLDKGLNIHDKDGMGDSLLHIACYRKNWAMIELLITKGINIDCKGNEGKTALHTCASRGSYEYTKYLLEKGASPMAVDAQGITPLMQAIINLKKPSADKSYDLIRLLARHSNKITYTNQFHENALRLAVESKDELVIEIIKAHYPKSPSNFSPLELATEIGVSGDIYDPVVIRDAFYDKLGYQEDEVILKKGPINKNIYTFLFEHLIKVILKNKALSPKYKQFSVDYHWLNIIESCNLQHVLLPDDLHDTYLTFLREHASFKPTLPHAEGFPEKDDFPSDKSFEALSHAEMCAINLYSGDLHEGINQLLRLHSRDQLVTEISVSVQMEIILAVAFCASGLNKCQQRHDTPVLRAEGQLPFVRKERNVKPVYEHAFTSASAGTVKSSASTILFSEGFGYHIGPLSQHPYETEVLLPPAQIIYKARYQIAKKESFSIATLVRTIEGMHPKHLLGPLLAGVPEGRNPFEFYENQPTIKALSFFILLQNFFFLDGDQLVPLFKHPFAIQFSDIPEDMEKVQDALSLQVLLKSPHKSCDFLIEHHLEHFLPYVLTLLQNQPEDPSQWFYDHLTAKIFDSGPGHLPLERLLNVDAFRYNIHFIRSLMTCATAQSKPAYLTRLLPLSNFHLDTEVFRSFFLNLIDTQSYGCLDTLLRSSYVFKHENLKSVILSTEKFQSDKKRYETIQRLWQQKARHALSVSPRAQTYLPSFSSLGLESLGTSGVRPRNTEEDGPQQPSAQKKHKS